MSLIYGLSLNVSNSGKTAYYYINLDQGQITGGGSVTVYPSAATQSATYVNIQSDLSIQAPAARITGGIVITADNGVIAGQVGVSPALAVPVTATLYGSSIIGSVTIQPGQTSADFNWNVSAEQALPGNAQQFLAAEVAQPAVE